MHSVTRRREARVEVFYLVAMHVNTSWRPVAAPWFLIRPQTRKRLNVRELLADGRLGIVLQPSCLISGVRPCIEVLGSAIHRLPPLRGKELGRAHALLGPLGQIECLIQGASREKCLVAVTGQLVLHH
eukprot:scaffold54429_cov28-Tisochrysis_lutea.AAC.2